MHQKDALFKIRISDTCIVLGTEFAQCNMNDVTIPHVLCIKKKLCTTSSVSERGDINSENQCGDLDNQFTLCEINNIKTEQDVFVKHKRPR